MDGPVIYEFLEVDEHHMYIFSILFYLFISKYIFISRKTFTIRLKRPVTYFVINWMLSNLEICIVIF